MVFGVKIAGLSENQDKVLLDIEAPWWNSEDLIKDSRFLVCEETAFHNYDANLSIEEIVVLHEKYKPNFVSGKYNKAIRSWLDQLDNALYLNSSEYRCFYIRVFEGIIGATGQIMTYSNGRVLPAEWYGD